MARAMYDLTKLEDLVNGEAAQTITLSPETIFLCLMALNDRISWRGCWVDDDFEITESRWDAALALVDRAKEELQSET